MTKRKVIFIVIGLLCICGSSFGLATEEFGPDSEIGHPTVDQPGWPTGIVELARHPSRVYSSWCNGNENFYFKTTPEQVNELITLFAKTRMRDHEVWIKADKLKVQSLHKYAIDYNVHLQMLNGIALSISRQEDVAGTFEPDLTIYVDGDAAWMHKLQMPDNIILHSEIDGLLLKNKKTKPNRICMYGRIQFKEHDYFTEYQKGNFAVRLTLWEEDIDDGIKVGQIDYKGYFRVPFSDEELSMLMKGDNWLTMTTGNHMFEARMDHPKYPPEKLNTEMEKAEIEYINMPEAYFGKVIFQDGAPVVSKESNARIMVIFPYAGMAILDADSCFRIYLTEEQFEELKEKKPRKNIYIPGQAEKNSSIAKHVFPVSALSRDKNKPGVVKIPRIEIAVQKDN